MSRPVPNPGILDIAPYTPGKSGAGLTGRIFKLSANETPLGPSPKAIEAFKSAADHLEDYPEGSSRALREAIGRTSGLDPDHIICGAGSDEILNLLANTYLGQGDEAIHTHARLSGVPDRDHGEWRHQRHRGRKNFTADVDAILKAVTPRTKIVWLANPNNPTGTCVPFDEVKRLRAGLPSRVLLVIDAAYSEYVLRNDYEGGIEMVSTTDNTVMTRTFLEDSWPCRAARRLDVWPCEYHRRRQPHSRSVQCEHAGHARSDRFRWRIPRIKRRRAFTEKWRAWLHRRSQQAGTDRHPERRKLHPDPLPAGSRQDRRGLRMHSSPSAD